MFTGIAVHMELPHYSVVYSSAIEPDLELNSFHETTAASTAFDLRKRSRCSRLTYSESSDSTTAGRLSVNDLAWSSNVGEAIRLNFATFLAALAGFTD